MNEGCLYIEEEEVVVFTCRKADTEPPGEWHDGVMVDMKESHLAVLFPQHKENLKRDTQCFEIHWVRPGWILQRHRYATFPHLLCLTSQ